MQTLSRLGKHGTLTPLDASLIPDLKQNDFVGTLSFSSSSLFDRLGAVWFLLLGLENAEYYGHEMFAFFEYTVFCFLLSKDCMFSLSLIYSVFVCSDMNT